MSDISKELSGVLVAVSDADLSSENADIEADAEVFGHKWAHTVALKDHLPLEEGSLGNT